MGNCFGKKSSNALKYFPVETSILESDIQLDDEQRRALICGQTELPISLCNCTRCIRLVPPLSLSGRPIEFSVEGDRLFCKYANSENLADITDEKPIFCKRSGVVRSILFNGEQFAFR